MEIIEVNEWGKEWTVRKQWKCDKADIKLIKMPNTHYWEVTIEWYGTGYQRQRYANRNAAMNRIRKLLTSK